MLLFAFICPPLYFLIKKQWGKMIVTGCMALVSLATLIIFPPITLLMWFVSVLMALFHWKSQRQKTMMEYHAKKIAEEIVSQQHAKHVS